MTDQTNAFSYGVHSELKTENDKMMTLDMYRPQFQFSVEGDDEYGGLPSLQEILRPQEKRVSELTAHFNTLGSGHDSLSHHLSNQDHSESLRSHRSGHTFDGGPQSARRLLRGDATDDNGNQIDDTRIDSHEAPNQAQPLPNDTHAGEGSPGPQPSTAAVNSLSPTPVQATRQSEISIVQIIEDTFDREVPAYLAICWIQATPDTKNNVDALVNRYESIGPSLRSGRTRKRQLSEIIAQEKDEYVRLFKPKTRRL